MNNFVKQKGKISTGFIVFISIVLTAFVAVMIYILTLPTPEELRAADSRKMDAIINAEIAANLGMSQEEYDKQQVVRERNSQHANKLRNAIIKKDTDLIVSLFKQIPDFDFKKYFVGIYREIAVSDNEEAFRYILKQGVPCGYDNHIGQHAFNATMRKGFEKYFNIIIEHGCDIYKEPGATNLKRIFARSEFPERILLFPQNELNKNQIETAFFRAIALKNVKSAFTFIDAGIDVNANKGKETDIQSALQLSIIKGVPEVALRLLEKGANIIKPKGTHNFRKHLILNALQKNQYAVVKAILEREPDYITREKIADDYFALALNRQGTKPDLNTLLMAYKNGISVSDFKDDGLHILFNAIKAENFDFVEKLIEIGVEVNKSLAMKTALGESKRSKNPAAVKISKLLMEKGATDDYLAIVREQRNIKSSINCKIGKEVSLAKIENQILELPQSTKDKLFRPSESICEDVLKFCFTEGIGSDDCVKSVNTCEQTNSGSVALTAESKNICCSESFKQDYEQGRCAGLNVFETFHWMESQ